MWHRTGVAFASRLRVTTWLPLDLRNTYVAYFKSCAIINFQAYVWENEFQPSPSTPPKPCIYHFSSYFRIFPLKTCDFMFEFGRTIDIVGNSKIVPRSPERKLNKTLNWFFTAEKRLRLDCKIKIKYTLWAIFQFSKPKYLSVFFSAVKFSYCFISLWLKFLCYQSLVCHRGWFQSEGGDKTEGPQRGHSDRIFLKKRVIYTRNKKMEKKGRSQQPLVR